MKQYPAYPQYSQEGFPIVWERKRLRFALKMNPSKSEIDLEDSDLVSFVPMDAVGEYGGIRLNEEKELGEIGSGYTYFRDDDVVVAKITPCFENAKGALAKGLRNKTAFGTTELHVMRADREQLEPEFLFYLTISDLFRKFGESEMYGAGGQKRVPESFIKDFRAGLPSVGEQQAIARFLDFKTAQIDALISAMGGSGASSAANERKKNMVALLQEYRSALITNAVTGKIDVRGFEFPATAEAQEPTHA
jgi:type I restriction enzyme, S subunit